MRRMLMITLLGIFITACETRTVKKEIVVTEIDSSIVFEEPKRSNMSFLNDYKALEDLFTNDNWLLINKKDSSYFYFSRLGDFQVNTYEYKIAKGDSSNVKHGVMQNQADRITWKFNDLKLYLSSISKTTAVWSEAGSDSISIKYKFEKIDKNTIRLTYPDMENITMKKMLPFSLFLLRSNYDFKHGTRYAFDTTQFNTKGKKK